MTTFHIVSLSSSHITLYKIILCFVADDTKIWLKVMNNTTVCLFQVGVEPCYAKKKIHVIGDAILGCAGVGI
jgi:hypothetical protein